MTSLQRRELRYARRKASRQTRKIQRCKSIGSIDDVFSYHKLFFWGKKCCNGVRWKKSTQNFELHLFSGTAARRKKILSGNWKPKRCVSFVISERGKTRVIDSPHISDRQIEKVLTKEILTPLFSPCLIYDNGASQSGKGLRFSYKRLKQHLRYHYSRYGRCGGVLLIDLKQFFPNASLSIIKQRHKELVLDSSLRELLDLLVDSVPHTSLGRGMPLGVEPSQQEMIALPSKIDNWIKSQKSVHCMGRYMDDYYIILPDINHLGDLLKELIVLFESSGIPVNRNKCKVLPLAKSFKYCKAKFTLTESGKIIVNGNRDGIKRIKRKLKMLCERRDDHCQRLREAAQLITSCIAYYKNYNDNGRFIKLKRICEDLFGGDIICTKSRALITAKSLA